MLKFGAFLLLGGRGGDIFGYVTLSVFDIMNSANICIQASQCPLIWNVILCPLHTCERVNTQLYWPCDCPRFSRHVFVLKALKEVLSLTPAAILGIGAAFTVPSAQAYIVLFFSEPKAKAIALGYWAASGSVGFV